MEPFISAFIWDVNRHAFTVPFLNLSIYWYGILFATGFFFGYLLTIYSYRRYLGARKQFYVHEIDFKQLTKNWSTLTFLHSLPSSLIKSIKEDCLSQNQKESICEYLSYLTLADVMLENRPLKLLKKEKRIAKFLERKRGCSENYLKRTYIETNFGKVFKPQDDRARKFVDRLTFYIVMGTVVGARLGHVLFYENAYYYLTHPLSIINTREGGLASHGGVVGIFLSLVLFCKSYKKLGELISWRFVIDMIIVPTAVAAVFIRLGNFVNQEIIGIPTSASWGIIFPRNYEGLSAVARHPAQLYEAFAYAITFFLLLGHFRAHFFRLKLGEMTGIFFILVFGARFAIEFIKESQLHLAQSHLETYLSMGQWLSIPFILFGVFLLLWARKSQDMVPKEAF
ncbi:MAG: prolipoprotein diacylglyceryl transferase [Rhabdochlamydiaceae bacterium]|nr:prolipoprotein diacylglyceryl transferase [Candidatus Amphrikana amoebophyrae]